MISRLARPLIGLVVATALTLGVAAAPVAAAPPPSDTTYSEARILWLLNEERRIHGLAPVRRHGGADHIAQWSANVNAWNGHLGHNPNLPRDVSERVTPNWRHIGENIGCAGDADVLHGMWMRSSGHRVNMLRAAEDTVGIGTVYARGCLWATVVFVDT